MSYQQRYTLTEPRKGSIVLGPSAASGMPQGWEDLEIAIKRDLKYAGCFFERSNVDTPVSFVGPGYVWLRELFDAYGAEADVTVLLEFRVDGVWTQVYRGRLDLLTLELDAMKGMASVSIEQDGVLLTIQRGIETPVNLLSPTAVVGGAALEAYLQLPTTFNLHDRGLLLLARTRLAAPVSVTGTAATPSINLVRSLPTGATIAEEVTNIIDRLTPPSPFFTAGSPLPYFTAAAAGDYTTRVRVKGRVKFDTPGATGYRATGADVGGGGVASQIEMVIKAGTSLVYTAPFVDRRVLAVSGQQSGGGVWEWPFEFEAAGIVTLAAGDNLYGFWNFDAAALGTASGLNVEVFYDECEAEVFNLLTFPSSTCLAVPVHEALARVMDSISGGAITSGAVKFRSEHMGSAQSEPSDVPYVEPGDATWRVVTTGKHLRKFPADTPMVVTLQQLIDSLRVTDFAGVGVDVVGGVERIRVEHRNFFYQQQVAITVQAPTNLKRMASKDQLYQAVEVKYAKWEVSQYVAESGGVEFNTEARAETARRVALEVLDLDCPAVTGGLPIEHVRRQVYLDKATKKTDWDEELFLIATKRTAATRDEAETNEGISTSTFTNLTDASRQYNLDFNPLRVMKRWMPELQSDLVLSERLGNTDYQVQWNTPRAVSGVYALDSDRLVRFSDLPTDQRRWVPELIEFEAPLQWSEFIDLQQNPYRLIEVVYLGDTLRGYIHELSYRISKAMATFKLIRAV